RVRVEHAGARSQQRVAFRAAGRGPLGAALSRQQHHTELPVPHRAGPRAPRRDRPDRETDVLPAGAFRREAEDQARAARPRWTRPQVNALPAAGRHTRSATIVRTATRWPVSHARVAAMAMRSAPTPSWIVTGAGRPPSTLSAKFSSCSVYARSKRSMKYGTVSCATLFFVIT